ncbi:hypothetical protein DA2_2188 [Desulfovibrio sp. A2]|nr:hypothetical protein DA2_2188 [Desulfovibrio sp. A2]
MTTFILLDGPDAPPRPQPASDGLPPVVAHWARRNVPHGHLSVPALVETHFADIRREYITWAHETGLTRPARSTRNLRELLAVGDTFSHWWFTTLAEKHPKICRNLYEVTKLRALELAVEDARADSVCVVTDDTTLANVLLRFCAATGRRFELHPTGMGAGNAAGAAAPADAAARSAKQRLAALYYRLPAPVQALARLGAWLLREKRLLPAAPEATGKASLPAHPRPSTVATYFPNIDVQAVKQGRLRSRYWESLHDALAPEQGGVHGVTWLFIFEPTPHYSLADAIRLRDEFRARKQDGIAFHFIEEFLTPATIAREVLHYCRMAFRAARLTRHVAGQCRLPGSRMDFWPYMERNWAESTRGWLGLQRRLMRAAFRQYAAVCPPQEWTIFPMENHPWEKSLTHAMHEARRGPVYGTQHSTVRPTDLRYYEDARAFAEPDAAATLPDLLCCNGQGALGHMRDAGMPAERLGEIEALRYLYLADVAAVPTASATVSATASAIDLGDTPGKPTLLIVTSFFIDETDNQLDVLAAAARAGTLDGYDVVVKPHPNLPVEGRLAARFPGGGAPRVVNTPVAQLLVPGPHGLVVWAANSTTVALEAAYQRLPLIVQTAANDFNMCPLLGVPGTTFVATADDLAAALAHPAPPDLPPGFLALDRGLPRWRRLLGMPEQ